MKLDSGACARIVTLLALSAGMPFAFAQQPVSREIINKAKKASAYIEVTHIFPLTGEKVPTSGSGYFINSNGHVVTNYHVIRPGIPVYNIFYPAPVEKIRVVVNSGSNMYRSCEAKVLAADTENDLAILATGADSTAFLPLGSSDKLFETAPVWIFGYPFGEVFSVIERGPEISVSKGAVSALRHDERGKLTTVQIDASVNPGNSGGAVIDARGQLVGTVKMILGQSPVNLAVPMHYLKSLLDSIPADPAALDTSRLDISCSPSKAYLFVDWKPAAGLPTSGYPLSAGWHTLYAVKPGFEPWVAQKACFANVRHDITLRPATSVPVLSGSHRQSAPLHTMPGYPHVFKPDNEILLSEGFDSPEKLKTWEQSTGGTEKRTWFIKNSRLHQHESNEMLHAVCLGDTSWSNYAVSAKIRITDEHDDSRAGLIFCESPHGFYLLRIHKETDKAQLAYHCKQPFGWFILDEKKLGFDIKDKWHETAVVAREDIILCYLDRKLIFASPARYASSGRVGMYSVESKASFDSLKVTKAPAMKLPSLAQNTEMLSFWFADYFSHEAVWWSPYAGNDNPYPWFITEGGCAQMAQDNTTRHMEFTRYLLSDFNLDFVVSLGEGADNARFEIAFRKRGKAYAAARFDKKAKKVLLEVSKGKATRIIKKKSLPASIFESTSRIVLIARGDELSMGTPQQTILKYSSKLMPTAPGTFAFSTTGVRAVIHQVHVSSIREE